MSQEAISDILAALVDRTPINAPVAMIVAHPDDETVGAGASLCLFRSLTLIHVTDGAPCNLQDAKAAGFSTREDYAAARRGELVSALRVGNVELHSQMASPLAPVPDQTASIQLPTLVAVIKKLLRPFVAVLTHPYEGGHPDHDAVAFAVQATGIPTIEMAGYHAAPDGGILVSRFLSEHGTFTARLTKPERARREAMLDCFVTQQTTLAPFRGMTEECFREAPAYDFTRPPAQRVYYDGFDWGMTSERWCGLATRALRC